MGPQCTIITLVIVESLVMDLFTLSSDASEPARLSLGDMRSASAMDEVVSRPRGKSLPRNYKIDRDIPSPPMSSMSAPRRGILKAKSMMMEIRRIDTNANTASHPKVDFATDAKSMAGDDDKYSDDGFTIKLQSDAGSANSTRSASVFPRLQPRSKRYVKQDPSIHTPPKSSRSDNSTPSPILQESTAGRSTGEPSSPETTSPVQSMQGPSTSSSVVAAARPSNKSSPTTLPDTITNNQKISRSTTPPVNTQSAHVFEPITPPASLSAGMSVSAFDGSRSRELSVVTDDGWVSGKFTSERLPQEDLRRMQRTFSYSADLEGADGVAFPLLVEAGKAFSPPQRLLLIDMRKALMEGVHVKKYSKSGKDKQARLLSCDANMSMLKWREESDKRKTFGMFFKGDADRQVKCSEILQVRLCYWGMSLRNVPLTFILFSYYLGQR